MCAEPCGRPAAWIRDLRDRVAGPVAVQLSPDIGVRFPVEVFDERGPGYVGPGMLGLTLDLEDDLVRWQRWWEDHMDVDGGEVVGGTPEEWRVWRKEGDGLLERLRHQLGPAFHVRWV